MGSEYFSHVQHKRFLANALLEGALTCLSVQCACVHLHTLKNCSETMPRIYIHNDKYSLQYVQELFCFYKILRRILSRCSYCICKINSFCVIILNLNNYCFSVCAKSVKKDSDLQCGYTGM